MFILPAGTVKGRSGAETYGAQFEEFLREHRALMFQAFVESFDFTCGRCGAEFDNTLVPINEDDPVLCAECGKGRR